jgi:PIN domain nuclease of toxin-antitoxin system
VLDASAVLALLHGEPGHETVLDHLEAGAVMSTVNWSEVIAKYQGGRVSGLRAGLEGLGLSMVPFTLEDAELVAAMWAPSRRMGLSLADRACLALGNRLRLPVLTAERRWDELNFGPSVVLIR